MVTSIINHSEKNYNDVSIESLLVVLKLYFNFLFFTRFFFLGFLGVLKQSEKNLIERGGEETEHDELRPTSINSFSNSFADLILLFRVFRICRLFFMIILKIKLKLIGG